MTEPKNTEQDPVDGFSADWLRLREPLDLAARSEALAQGFKSALKPRNPLPFGPESPEPR